MHSTDNNEDHIEAVFDSIPEALVEIGIDSRILRANRAFEKLFSVDAKKVIGRSLIDFTDSLKAICPANKKNDHESKEENESPVSLAIRNSDGEVSGYCSFTDKNQNERYLGWVLCPLEFRGAARGRLLTLMDLTEKQELKAALLHQHEDFLAVLNHRLRTPVLAANRVIHLMLDGQFGEMSEEQKQVISLMGDNMAEINRLMVMIMDIYRFRTVSKVLSFAPCRIDSLLKELLAGVKKAGLKIEVENNCPQAVLNCDRDEISIMLSHLIENAVKYAQSRVTVQVDQISGDRLQIQVEDDGQGIKDKDIKDLFNRFYLISKDGKYAATTGAGLCLCAEIAKAHGGEISCQSRKEKGTSFLVRLPLSHNGHEL